MKYKLKLLLPIPVLLAGLSIPPQLPAHEGETHDAESAEAPAGETVSLSQLREQTHFHGIAVDPRIPSRLYLATHHGLFLLYPDGHAVRLSENRFDYMGFVPHPNDPEVLYASGHPPGGGNLGFIVSSDGGKTWKQRSAGVGGPVDFHQMDVSKADPEVIYGVYGKLQVSNDGGRSWEVRGPLPEGMIDLAASGTAVDVVYAATRGGLLYSRDGGRSWRHAYLFKQPASMVHATRSGEIYAFLVGVGLIKTTEPELDWNVISKDWGESYVLHLAVDPQDPTKLYAITQGGFILASFDGGRDWKPLGEQ